MKRLRHLITPLHGAFDRLRALSVGQKLILIYVFGIFVPLVVANGLVLRSVLRDAHEQGELFLASGVQKMATAVAREFEPIELVSEFVYADSSIYRLLSSEYTRFQEYFEAHRSYLDPAVTKYANVFTGISRVTIYTENPVLNVSSGYLRLNDHVLSSDWYRRFDASNRRLMAFAHVDTDPRTELLPARYLSLFRELDNSSISQEGRLILRIDINPGVITRHLATPELLGTVELRDPSGNVAGAAVTGEPAGEVSQIHHLFDDSGTLAGWSLRARISPAGSPSPWSTRWTLLLVTSGLSVGFSSLFILLLSRSVTSRLHLLSRQMRRVEHEDFSPIELPGSSNDEVGRLIVDYNLMASRMDVLINEQYKSELERHQLTVARQQAELDALQSQVNPHFLYNVLESIRMKAHIRGEHETARVVKMLSRSLRRLASWSEDLVAVSEELEFTQEYVEVQQYRFGDRLRAEIHVDPEAREVRIPKLTIQSLVENACVHGLEASPDGGSVEVNVGVDGSDLIIRISDNGAGCDPRPIQTLIRTQKRGPRHIGIANVHRRLDLHFGDAFTFSFNSTPGAGTQVEIHIRNVHVTAHASHG
ncbi:MAG: sensor histidine kinase [Spirochaetota bacterium]